MAPEGGPREPKEEPGSPTLQVAGVPALTFFEKQAIGFLVALYDLFKGERGA